MRKTITALVLAVGLVLGAFASPNPAAAVACSSSDTASWGCSGTVWYWPSAGKVRLTVDDFYVQAHWTTSQSNVSSCTYVKVRSANSGLWYTNTYWRDCGGSPADVNIDMPFPIDSVRIESKDNRGRWRYLTVEGYS